MEKPITAVVQAVKQPSKTDPSSRMAIDPVSGNEVDKATCIIGADASGNTFYFENEENLMAYQPPAE